MTSWTSIWFKIRQEGEVRVPNTVYCSMLKTYPLLDLTSGKHFFFPWVHCKALMASSPTLEKGRKQHPPVKAGVNTSAWGRTFYHNTKQKEQLQAPDQPGGKKQKQTESMRYLLIFRVTWFLINVYKTKKKQKKTQLYLANDNRVGFTLKHSVWSLWRAAWSEIKKKNSGGRDVFTQGSLYIGDVQVNL